MLYLLLSNSISAESQSGAFVLPRHRDKWLSFAAKGMVPGIVWSPSRRATPAGAITGTGPRAAALWGSATRKRGRHQNRSIFALDRRHDAFAPQHLRRNLIGRTWQPTPTRPWVSPGLYIIHAYRHFLNHCYGYKTRWRGSTSNASMRVGSTAPRISGSAGPRTRAGAKDRADYSSIPSNRLAA